MLDQTLGQLITEPLCKKFCIVACTVISFEEKKMNLLDQKTIGIVILILLAILVAVKRIATGSIFDKPKGGSLVQTVNIFNLFFLLVVNPLAAILLILGSLATADLTRITIGTPWILMILEIAGLVMYTTGFLVMAWALIRLGHHYQLGGSAPRSEDRLVEEWPYRQVRHPMYAAALSISLGLACLSQSMAFFGVFCVYLALVLPLINIEEDGLRNAYGERYTVYQQKTKKLIPLVY
jgi:protein-S-isoprenylcysteine O-methyltransferase Ste14